MDSVDWGELGQFPRDEVSVLCVDSWGLTLSDYCANSGHRGDAWELAERVLFLMLGRQPRTLPES